MATDTLAVALVYIAIGIIVAILFVFVFRREVLGHFLGALLVALIGAFLGGVIEIAFADLIARLTDVAGVNIFPPIIAATILLAVFSVVSNAHSGRED